MVPGQRNGANPPTRAQATYTYVAGPKSSSEVQNYRGSKTHQKESHLRIDIDIIDTIRYEPFKITSQASHGTGACTAP